MRVHKMTLVLGLTTSFIVVPVVMLMPYNFDFGLCWDEQIAHWQPSGAISDWVLLGMIRDLSLLCLTLVAGRRQESEKVLRTCQPLRRPAFIFLALSVWRLAALDWHGKVVPPAVASVAASITILLLATVFKRAQSRADQERESLLASMQTIEATDESQDDTYSSSLSMWQMIKVMRPYFWPSSGNRREVAVNRFLATMTWLCVVGSKTSNVLAPLSLQIATNSVANALSAGQPFLTADIAWHLILYAMLGLFSKLLNELQSVIYIPVRQTAYIEIADSSFRHLHGLSLDWHLRKKQGGVIRSMQRGLTAAQDTMQYIVLYLLPTIAEAVAVVFVFFFHFNNATLAAYVLLNLMLYGYVTIKITEWRKTFRTQMAKKDNEVNDRLADSLTNFETVKYFTAEQYEAAEYRKAVSQYQQGSSNTQLSMRLLNVLQQGIIYATLAGGLLQATAVLLRGHHDLGEFVAVNTYIVQIFAPLSFLGTIYNMAINALVDMYAFGQLLAERSDVNDKPGCPDLDVKQVKPGVPMVEFSGVTFNYKNQPQMRSLKNISWSVARGNMLALVGSTGAGKTTMARLLFRFYDPVSGSVSINGCDLRDVTQRSVRAAIGMVPQDVVMFNSSIRHNIRYGNVDTATEADIEMAADKAQLAEFISQQPQQYETLVGERGLKLSGGEKQRLAIARCLVKNPPIVVLDEATSALDSQTEQRVQKALHELSHTRTVMAIAHRLSTIKNFDEILVLENGEIIQRGTHDALLKAKEGKYAEMWNRQISGLQLDASEVNLAQGA